MMNVITIVYRLVSAIIGLGFVVNTFRTEDYEEQFLSVVVALPFILRAITIK